MRIVLSVLLPVVLFFAAPSCKSTKIPDKLDANRVELYELVDAVRAIDPETADELLAILVQLELIATALDAANPGD